METIYTLEEKPIKGYSIFLCGPTPRDKITVSWRKEAVEILKNIGFKGTVIIPEPQNGIWPSTDHYESIVDWEEKYISMADKIVFWVCRDYNKNLKGMTTNIEFGLYLKNLNIIYGRPDNADDIRNLDYRYKKYHNKLPHNTLNLLLLESILK